VDGFGLKKREPVIVFGSGITGLGISRNLGKEGINVYCISDRFDAASFSRYCRKTIILPNFRERKGLVKAFLTSFSKKVSPRGVVFATDDLVTLLLSELKSEIKDDFYFLVPEIETAEKVVNKRKFHESLENSSIPHPKTVIPANRESIRSSTEELRFPILVKPSISPIFVKEFGIKSFVARSQEELLEYQKIVLKHNIDVIFQEIIPGPDSNLYGIPGTFGRGGKALALFAYRRIRGWPITFGNNSIIESVALEKLSFLKEAIKRYMEANKYYGVAEAEFKLDPRDGLFKILEMNARSWWQNSFPTKCGLNIILKAYLDAIGEDVAYSEDYVEGLKWINLPNDLLSSVFEKKLFTREWFKSVRNVRAFSFFDLYDPWPFATNLLFQLRGLASLIS
jgi:predicted ATP-grasp superfamily ATP-dependent carboligase